MGPYVGEILGGPQGWDLMGVAQRVGPYGWGPFGWSLLVYGWGLLGSCWGWGPLGGPPLWVGHNYSGDLQGGPNMGGTPRVGIYGRTPMGATL